MSNPPRVHFAADIEEKKTAMVEERPPSALQKTGDGAEIAQGPTGQQTTAIKSALKQGADSTRLSQVSQEARRKQEELNKKRERQRIARNIHVTTNDQEVKLCLRALKQPITYFGEVATGRRERLKALVRKIYIETGEMPVLPKLTVETTKDDENEHFFYEGSSDLKQTRLEFADFSLKRAAVRIERSKLKKLTVDPLEEEAVIDKEVARFSDLDMLRCEFADTSIASRGVFSPDAQLYATSGWSGACRVWAIPNCEMKAELTGHLSKAIDLTFHPQSCLTLAPSAPNIATASVDCTIRLWSLDFEATRQTSHVLKGHEDRVNRIRFHPLGKQIFSTSHDKTWRMWDLETKKDILTQTGHSKPVYALAVHPDGSLVYTGDLGGFGMMWDLRTGKSILPLFGHVKQIICADISVDGYHVVTGGDDNTLRVWDLRRKNCLMEIPAHTKLISDVKFEPNNGRFLLSSAYDCSFKIWSTKDWSLGKNVSSNESKLTSVSITQDFQYCLLYTSPSPRDRQKSRMPSSA
eukprot:TRINITY_DN7216_c0_g2_i1.p1 TRINITY_DN7216_c0_g2~~TRINITY_DN7216_c0_g2_i1.p1  ORF type:complete len:523 (-),score=97.80 TRINITY_DN7216_c0_g2_i1:10-1578(-)